MVEDCEGDVKIRTTTTWKRPEGDTCTCIPKIINETEPVICPPGGEVLINDCTPVEGKSGTYKQYLVKHSWIKDCICQTAESVSLSLVANLASGSF